ncbi:MAG TPA: glutathione S-transferase family protein [Solirubrobacterales bacterium]|nr:glutathione S-transferase family protein [Solirubrobacterales bacterium]
MVNGLLDRSESLEPDTHPRDRRQPPVLWHLKVSHYNEKARWALDYKRVPHVRHAAIPGRHARIAQSLGAGRTFPVLELDGQILGDSTLIIHALERRYPDPPLYPADPADTRRALEIEDFFDEEFGAYLRLLVLEHMLPDPRLFLGAFAPDLNAPRRLVARAMYPLMRRKIAADFGIDRSGIERAWRKCRLAGERFAAELQANGYLVGGGFTVADLTVAALLSPVVAPEQFPYPQPQRDHSRLADLRRMIDDWGALEWARWIYAHHRSASMEVARMSPNANVRSR